MYLLDVDLMIATNYAVFRGNLRKAGKLIDKFDLLIASTCFAHRLVLVAENREHFKRVPGLEMYKHKN